MEWLAQILRSNPVIPVFLTIGLGFWIGHMKYKAFTLGPVAATLLVGVAIGQLQIPIPDAVKSIFFMLFLFSIGYSVGPQFFRAFRGHGLKQVAFAFMEASICATTVVLAAKIMGYDTGVALGIFAGSQTASASLGITSETIKGLAMAAESKEHLLAIIPACYAVTYVFGTAGSAWFLSSIAPMLLGGLQKVKEECRALESAMDSGEFIPDEGAIEVDRAVSFRAYRAESHFFHRPRTVEEIEADFAGRGERVFVERLRIRGEIKDPEPHLKVARGDTIVLSARREVILEGGAHMGPEIVDHELMSFGAENLPVTVAKKGAAGLSFGQLRRKPWMRGVIVRSLTRNNVSIPARSKTQLEPGDVLTLVGLTRDVQEAAARIGYADKNSDTTDMVFLGLGIAIGCFFGALSFKFDGVPISLSTSGGALLAGLFLGWLRNTHPTFGHIPNQVIWIFDNLGLNMFIAVVGITSGARFLSGLKEAGLGLFFVGIVCTIGALVINILLARKVFGFTRPETLGCVAGARCGVASIGAIQDALESTVPALGYTVTYAVANLVLVFSSLIVLALV